MPEYPIRVPRSEHEHELAASIEAYINSRFANVSAERLTFSYRVIATELAVPIESVREVLAPLDGGNEGLMVWRKRKGEQHVPEQPPARTSDEPPHRAARPREAPRSMLWLETQEGQATVRSVGSYLYTLINELRHGRLEEARQLLAEEIVRAELVNVPEVISRYALNATRRARGLLDPPFPPRPTLATHEIERLLLFWTEATKG